jgi:hypothetical protein
MTHQARFNSSLSVPSLSDMSAPIVALAPTTVGAANSNPAVLPPEPQKLGADEAPFFFPEDPFGPCRNITAFRSSAFTATSEKRTQALPSSSSEFISANQ